jgi:formylmethanofuran dehydrogenase subunit A
MLTRLAGGHVIDPVHGQDGVADIWMRDGRIVATPEGGEADVTHDLGGKVVMAGAIDIHSHIAGANVNTARLLLPHWHPASADRPDATWLTQAGWSTDVIGRLYAAMGYTTVVEPAVAPHHALHAHLELADTPIIDTAILSILGNDDFLLGLLRDGESGSAIADYAAWTLSATRGLGIKVINAGGAMAFKSNLRAFSLDDVVPDYGVTSRQIVAALQKAVDTLGVPHPVHVHCNNLGMAGNVETALATIAGFDGLPVHLAHVQFYAYGTEGGRGFSSAAPRLAEAVNKATTVTVDVGQVMFGQTTTISSDVLRQFNARDRARPRKWVIYDGDSNGGGMVPYEYRRSDFFNAVQWAAGLELFLLIDDPWRVFFTTDHPNGAPFTSYPDLMALLMSRNLRTEWMATLPAEALAVTTLASISREYTLTEIATMTRAAPARLLGLSDRGHLGAGARADIAVYDFGDPRDRADAFRHAALVFKDGELVVRDGTVVSARPGRALSLAPEPDAAIGRRLQAYYESRYGMSDALLRVPEWAVGRPQSFEVVSCGR